MGTDLVVEEEEEEASSLDLFLFWPLCSEAKSGSSGSSGSCFTLNPRNSYRRGEPTQRTRPRGEPTKRKLKRFNLKSSDFQW